jgi:hypothetical protein
MRLDSHARVAWTGVAFGPPMSMIRHRFGGNLRAARASVSAPSSVTHRRSLPRLADPVGGRLWMQHRAPGVHAGEQAGRVRRRRRPRSAGANPDDSFEEERE